jgi:hypothetical protein
MSSVRFTTRAGPPKPISEKSFANCYDNSYAPAPADGRANEAVRIREFVRRHNESRSATDAMSSKI